MTTDDDNTTALRWRWEKAARTRMPAGVNVTAQALAWQLASYSNQHGEQIRPSLERLASAMGVVYKTVSRARSLLVKAQMIEEVRKARPGLTPTYRLRDPADWRDVMAVDTGPSRREVSTSAGLREEMDAEPLAAPAGPVCPPIDRPVAETAQRRGVVGATRTGRLGRSVGTRPPIARNPELAARMRAEKAAEADARLAATDAATLENDPLLADLLGD